MSRRFARKYRHSPHTAIIPGCATWRRPGIHTPDRGYGFRARASRAPERREWNSCESRIRFGYAQRQQPFLDRLDLQRQIFRIDPALREAAGDEPEAGLAGAGVHIAQFLILAEAPDRADALGDLVAEQFAHQMLLALVAGRQHDQVGGNRLATAHSRAFGNKAVDVGKLREANLARNDKVGAADIEIIAAAAGEIFEL